MRRVLVVLIAAAAGACASAGGVPQPFPGAPAPPSSRLEPAPGALPRAGYAVAGTALSLRGIPYRNGGTHPDTGFDCSGLVSYVFEQHGLQLPRSVAEQYRAGRTVSADALEPGDLVFFSTKASGPTHVGIVIGGDEFVHAPTSNGVVRVERLGMNYWSSRFVGARRVTGR